MKYNYAVIGAGKTGTAVVCDLLKYGSAKNILVLDCYSAALNHFVDHLRKTDAPGQNRVVVSRRQFSEAQLEFSDIVISCAPYSENDNITRICNETNTPMCDLGGSPDMVALQKQLSKNCSNTICADCGISPGISNMLAVDLIKRGHHNIKIRCGGIPIEKPLHNLLGYQLLFNVDGLISEYSGWVPTLEDGKLVLIPALSQVELIDEYHEASPTSNNSPETVEYFKSLGVKNYNYMTIRYNDHWKIVKQMGLDELKEMVLRDPAFQIQDPDKLILNVKGQTSDVSMSYEMLVKYDERNNISAMANTTAWGITIPAKIILDHKLTQQGFGPPEKLLTQHLDLVIYELRRRTEVTVV